MVHTVLGPTSFRAEYRRSSGASILSRSVKFQVDIIKASTPMTGTGEVYCVDFQLISGTCLHFPICRLELSFAFPLRSVYEENYQGEMIYPPPRRN